MTNRDAWCVNSSPSKLESNIYRLISNYWRELERKLSTGYSGDIENFVDTDPKQFSWTRALKADLRREKRLDFGEGGDRSAYLSAFHASMAVLWPKAQ
ncbi:hypothetical protein HAALTHF_05290n [Vreelandella aquamarina]|nr:hypothetical protein HAALTHF_05290n [Halomonas axialensis]